MRSATPFDLAGLCSRCWQRANLCLCAEIPRIDVKTKIVILRHAKESWRTSNTARLASLAIPGLEVIEIGAVPVESPSPSRADFLAERARTEDAVARAIGAGAWLLFPSNREPPVRSAEPGVLVVPDGSWRQARRMIQRVPSLDRLPRLSLPAAPPTRRLRAEPLPEGMSTIEAIARALALIEGEAIGRPLLDLYSLHVSRQLEVRRRTLR